jgi:AmmeMemoRadiSam system protein B
VNQQEMRPRLRQLEATPTEHDGQQVIILRDPLHLSDAALVIPMGLVPVLQRLDGSHMAGEIRRECLDEHNIDIPEKNIYEVFSRLEEAHFLEGEGFEKWQQKVVSDFIEAPTRPSFLAGKSYDADPAALRRQIDGFFTAEGGPGLPELNGGAPRAAAIATLRGLVAPHIDFGRGGPTFAWSYWAAAERADADVFVILGTVHAPTLELFSLTRKSFETPLGLMEVDGEYSEGLARRSPMNLYRDEFAQRGEHSIEFQVVFLRYLYSGNGHLAGRAHPKFVPILVGSFGEFVAGGTSPRENHEVEGFIEALKETTAELEAKGRKVCYLASVDLAHVGPQFGDEQPVDEAQLEALEVADRASLDAVCRGDADGFYWSVASDGDARKVCGLAPIYTMLRAMETCSGEVLNYSQWPDPEGTVTFCGVALH